MWLSWVRSLRRVVITAASLIVLFSWSCCVSDWVRKLPPSECLLACLSQSQRCEASERRICLVKDTSWRWMFSHCSPTLSSMNSTGIFQGFVQGCKFFFFFRNVTSDITTACFCLCYVCHPAFIFNALCICPFQSFSLMNSTTKFQSIILSSLHLLNSLFVASFSVHF